MVDVWICSEHVADVEEDFLSWESITVKMGTKKCFFVLDFGFCLPFDAPNMQGLFAVLLFFIQINSGR